MEPFQNEPNYWILLPVGLLKAAKESSQGLPKEAPSNLEVYLSLPEEG